MCDCEKVDQCAEVDKAYKDGKKHGREQGIKTAVAAVMTVAKSKFCKNEDVEAQFLRLLAKDINAL